MKVANLTLDLLEAFAMRFRHDGVFFFQISNTTIQRSIHP